LKRKKNKKVFSQRLIRLWRKSLKSKEKRGGKMDYMSIDNNPGRESVVNLGVERRTFSREYTVHMWRNLMGEGKVRGKVEKIVKIYGKPDKVLMESTTMMQYIKPQDETGYIRWRSQEQGKDIDIEVDKVERIGTEKDKKTGETLAIVLYERGKLTKAGHIRQVAWRFSPLKSK